MSTKAASENSLLSIDSLGAILRLLREGECKEYICLIIDGSCILSEILASHVLFL